MSSNLQVNDEFMNRKLESQEIYGSVSIVILKRGQVMSIKDYRIHKWNVNLKIQAAHSPTNLFTTTYRLQLFRLLLKTVFEIFYIT